jgi:radical SAM protein with 4Fe4S-binding SPASM domain
MGYYILDENIALRSWLYVPYAYYTKNVRTAKKLTQDEFILLDFCDGNHDIEECDILERLVERGLCHPCKEGEYSISQWQRPHVYEHRYFPSMIWMVTGKCNYNCLHCFNAADENTLQSEFSLEEANSLLDQARDCGINSFTLTGGEPFVNPHFMDIVKGIYERDMYVEEINTNGCFITQDILDEFKRLGCNPIIKISYDGIGYHDLMRNKVGAQEEAMRAIMLCLDNGFRVQAQMNVHRLNLDSTLKTLEYFDSLGLYETRVIRTSESPRWSKLSKKLCEGGASLSVSEYYDGMLEVLKGYIEKPRNMLVDIWMFAKVYPREMVYSCTPIRCEEGGYRDSIPVCKGNRGKIAVCADGNLVPCHQISGHLSRMGVCLGNVKQTPLRDLLTKSDYLDSVCKTVGDLRQVNKKCAECAYWEKCLGGCRILAAALSEDYDVTGPDFSKCYYFENGYLEKTQEIFNEKGYKEEYIE